jgi:hypothetical protein
MLIKCPECQRDVSDTAPSCPGCGYVLAAAPVAAKPASPFQHLPSYHAPGAPAPKMGSWVWWAVGAAVVIFITISVLASSGQYSAVPVSSTQPVAAASASSNGAVLPPPSGPWSYTQTSDALHDKPTKTACTTSTNKVILSPPYSDVDAELCIRQSPQYGLDVFVKLDGDGQILCDLEGCSIPVRFDSGPLGRFGGASAADNSSNIIFLHGASKLIAAMKRSKTTVVQIRLYQDGDQAMTFPTAGLKW